MRRTLLLGLVALLGCAGCAVGHSEGWKRADLERNSLNLGLYRLRSEVSGPGMLQQRFTGRALSASVEYGEVVARGGTAGLGDGGDLYVVVRYEFDRTGLLGAPEEPRVECWRFTTPDGYDVEFGRTDCP